MFLVNEARPDLNYLLRVLPTFRCVSVNLKLFRYLKVSLRFSPPPSLFLPLWRPDFFGEFGLRQRILLCCLGTPPLQPFVNVLHVSAGDSAVLDDVVEILAGDECLRLATGDLLQARLLGNDVAECESDAVRDLNVRADFSQELRCRGVNTLLPRHTFGAEGTRLLIKVLAKQKCQEERLGDRTPLLDAGIDAGEHQAETGMRETLTFGVQPGGESREKRRKDTALAEEVGALRPFSRKQDLEHLVVEARRRGLDNGVGSVYQRLPGFFFHREAEQGGKPYRPQHPHRVFLKPDRRVAYGADDAGRQVGKTAAVVYDREIGNVVGKSIDGEVAAQGVFFGGAVDVVPQDHAVVIFQHVRVPLPLLHSVRLNRFRFRFIRCLGTKGCHLDDLFLEVNVREAEAPTDQTAAAEQPLHLSGGGVGDDVKILRFPSEQEIAHATADERRNKAVILQPVENTQGIRAHERAGDPVLLTRDNRRAELFGVFILFHAVLIPNPIAGMQERRIMADYNVTVSRMAEPSFYSHHAFSTVRERRQQSAVGLAHKGSIPVPATSLRVRDPGFRMAFELRSRGPEPVPLHVRKLKPIPLALSVHSQVRAVAGAVLKTPGYPIGYNSGA